MWQKLKQVLGHGAKSTQLLAEIRAGSDNQQRLINDKLGETIGALMDVSNVLRNRLDAVIAGIENNSSMVNNKLDALIAGLNNQSRILNEKLDTLIAIEARRSSGGAGSDPVEPRRSSR
jgi:hypothetical protein